MEDSFPQSPLWSCVHQSYNWPRNTLENDVNYVTHGRFDNLPQSPSKVVRIFMSSTFTDFYTERNCLIMNVYPKLQKICKEKYDLDFQVVDMRWGIRSEASVDHSASELCMKEIEMCKKLSVGPTFVTLLSHRYGGRPLPTTILQDEMDIILNTVRREDNSEDKLKMIDRWYKLDTNVHPHEFILQPIVNYKDMEKLLQSEQNHVNSYDNMLSDGKTVWKEEEPLLSTIIREAVKTAIQEGIMAEQCQYKYTQSITEEEIREGIVNESNTKDRCLAFVRDIEDVNLKHDKAWRFVEIENGEIHQETSELLDNVKHKVIPEFLPKENIHYFTTKWSDDGGINENQHADYLKSFCESFERSILDLIERGVTKQPTKAIHNVYSEALEHSHQCVQRVQRFHGRQDILDRMNCYVMSTSDQPLVVHGESGCGKTSVMAKAAMEIPSWLGDDESLLVILRFLGTTPNSSTVYKTLANISTQLVLLLGMEQMFPELPQEFQDLKDVFLDILTTVPSNKRVVLLLDSLDQLSDANNAHKLLWLPNRLPSNVKLIVSTLPNEGYILNTLKSKQMKDSQFVCVQDLNTNNSHDIIDMWLKQKGRSLNETQKQILDGLISKDVRPLYLKLIFDEISNWKSYEVPVFECTTISSCLQRLYRKLETKHGHILVSKALGYLSASQNGLTEVEIEDILSLDDEVLNDVFEYHIPPVRRLPSILWARIRSDLSEYIVDRDADGVKVMAWYHRQFIREAHDRYLPASLCYTKKNLKDMINVPLYKNIADYFAGIWANGEQKPFQYNQKQAAKLNMSCVNAKENRFVPSQPVVYKTESGVIDLENIRYNRRKLSELPYALLAVNYHEDNKTFIAKHIALNQEFLAAWIKTTPWEEINYFLEAICEDSSFHEETVGLTAQMSIVQQSLLLSNTSVLNNPTYLGPDISARLLQYNGILEDITDWIKYTDNEGRKMCALIPPHMQLETAGSEVLFIISPHTGPVYDAKWAAHDDTLCLSASKKFVCFSLETQEVTIDARPRSMPKDDSFNMILSVDDEENDDVYYVSLKHNPWVYIFDTEGEVLDIIDFTAVGYGSFTIDKMYVTCIDEQELCVIDTSKSFGIMVFNALEKSRRFQSLSGKDENSKILNMIIESRGRILVFDDRGSFRLCNLDGKTIDERSFDWPMITADNVLSDINNKCHKIMLGFENGQISVLTFKACDKNLQNMGVFNLFSRNQVKLKAKYGVPQFVHLNQGYNTPVVSLACTDTQLLVLDCKNTGIAESKKLREMENEDISSLQVLCRMNRCYNKAIFTSRFTFILAARFGTLDIFKIGDLHTIEEGRVSISYFSTIDCHGQEITSILSTCEDMSFMTSSVDSSLKLFVPVKAGTRKKCLPNFDRTEGNIKEVLAVDDFALTLDDNAREIHQWELFHGRIKNIFTHPTRGTFMKCSMDDNMGTIAALDIKGRLFIWSVPKKEPSTFVLSKPPQIQNPEVDVAINNVMTFTSQTSGEDVHMLVFEDGTTFLASKVIADVRMLYPFNKKQQEFLPDLKGPFQHCLKLTGERLLLIKQGRIFVINILTRTCDIRDKDLLNGADISDIKYASDTDSIVCISNGNVIIWDIKADQMSQVKVEYMEEQFKLMSTLTSVCIAVTPANKGYMIFDTRTSNILTTKHLKIASQPWQMYSCTPDGRYLIYVFGDKQVHLVRLSDGKLLAWYTMYNKVQSLTTSGNSWYVLIGTSDRRLFVLLIADPDEREHDGRILYAREMNPSLTMEETMALLEEADEYDECSDNSDDEYLIENDLNRSNSGQERKIKVLFSSDSSDEDDDMDTAKATAEETDPINTPKSAANEAQSLDTPKSGVTEGDDTDNSESIEGDVNGTPVYDGQLYFSKMCSLQ